MARQRLVEDPLSLYGSSRLGQRLANVSLTTGFNSGTSSSSSNGTIFTCSLNQRQYELTDHLGNVRAVIGDRKRVGSGSLPFAVDVQIYTNYYAFGMATPHRNYQGTGYGYGYNGKEKDPEFLNNYDYGFRIYIIRALLNS